MSFIGGLRNDRGSGIALIGIPVTVIAHADNSGMYLQLHDSTGIDHHNPQSAVEMGSAACISLDAFADPTQIEAALVAAMYSPRAARGIRTPASRCPARRRHQPGIGGSRLTGETAHNPYPSETTQRRVTQGLALI